MPTCIICLDILKDPAALPCGHVFCYRCIIQVVRNITPYTQRHFCPSCRQPYTISQVDPTLVPHHLQQHVTPAIRKLHLEYNIPTRTQTSSAASECDQLRAEVASLRSCSAVWRRRAAVHAAATLGLVGLARIARDSALKMKAEKDALEAKYLTLKKTFEETQTLSTFPPQRQSEPKFCETLCDTPLSVSVNPSRAASPSSFRMPSPSPSNESYCSDCAECHPTQKRKREEHGYAPLKRIRSNELPMKVSQSPDLAKLALEEHLKDE